MNSIFKHFNLSFIGPSLFFSTFLLIILFPISLPAQLCTGGIELTSQTAIDNFDCTSLEGSITIREAVPGNITNLDGLASLTEWTDGYALKIEGNTALTNIDGLSALDNISDLRIFDNDSLTNIDGLGGFASYSSYIWIEGNDSLTNVDGLGSIGVGAYVENLRIINNDSLTNVDGLSELTRGDEVRLEDNDALTNVDGLSALDHLGSYDMYSCWGGIFIVNNNVLTNVDGLANFKYSECEFHIEGNDSLSRCCGIYPFLMAYNDGRDPPFFYGPEINENFAGCNNVEEIISAGPCPLLHSVYIQAEDYDEGGQHIGYFDRTPGNAGGQYRSDDVDIWRYGTNNYYTGANATGEWLNYTIDVPSDGNYRLDIRVATPKDNRRVHVEFDGVSRTGSMTVPNTGGWTTWQTLSRVVTLRAGHQVMRLVIEYGGFNIDQMSLVPTDDPLVATPTINPNGGTFIDSVEVTLAIATAGARIFYTTDGTEAFLSNTSMEYISPFTLNKTTMVRAYAVRSGGGSDEAIAHFIKGTTVQELTIQAEDYDQGGQHVGYFDKTPGNSGDREGTNYRQDDVDLWTTPPIGKNYYTGANATGEWLNYTIDVPFSGNYRLVIRLGTPKDNRRLHVEFDGVDKTGSLIVPNTGWWTTWQTLNTNVTLDVGMQVMRLVIEYGGFNFDYISLEYLGN